MVAVVVMGVVAAPRNMHSAAERIGPGRLVVRQDIRVRRRTLTILNVFKSIMAQGNMECVSCISAPLYIFSNSTSVISYYRLQSITLNL